MAGKVKTGVAVVTVLARYRESKAGVAAATVPARQARYNSELGA